MTEQEIDGLQPGNMIKWEYVDSDQYTMEGTLLVYGAYRRRECGEYVFVVLLDLSTGDWGGSLRMAPGNNIYIMSEELEDECSLIAEIPSSD